jgi:hypothetical protein
MAVQEGTRLGLWALQPDLSKCGGDHRGAENIGDGVGL